MLPLIGSLIGAGASLIGGAMNNSAQSKANAANIAAQAAANKQNYKAQKEFAQHGLRWKVEDANRAGIHPLYAVGAPAQSFSASFGAAQSQPLTGMGDALSSAGQDVGRAVSQTLTPQEKVYNQTIQALQLDRASLENDLLRSQINRQRVETSRAAFPSMSADGLMFHGSSWDKNPQTSDAQEIEDRYGDLVSALYGVGVIGSDVLHNKPAPSGAATPGRSLSNDYANWAARERLRVYLQNPRRVGNEVYAGIF